MSDRKWRRNPGKVATPRDKEKRVWIKFRNGVEYGEKVRAGSWNWQDRGFDFDIAFFSEE